MPDFRVGDRVRSEQTTGFHYRQTGVIVSIGNINAFIRWDSDNECNSVPLNYLVPVVPVFSPAQQRLIEAVDALKTGVMPQWLRDMPAPCLLRVRWKGASQAAIKLDEKLSALGPMLKEAAEL